MSVRVLSTVEDKHGVEGGWAISHSGAFHLLGSWLLKVTSAHVQILGLITRIFRIFFCLFKICQADVWYKDKEPRYKRCECRPEMGLLCLSYRGRITVSTPTGAQSRPMY